MICVFSASHFKENVVLFQCMEFWGYCDYGQVTITFNQCWETVKLWFIVEFQNEEEWIVFKKEWTKVHNICVLQKPKTICSGSCECCSNFSPAPNVVVVQCNRTIVMMPVWSQYWLSGQYSNPVTIRPSEWRLVLISYDGNELNDQLTHFALNVTQNSFSALFDLGPNIYTMINMLKISLQEQCSCNDFPMI